MGSLILFVFRLKKTWSLLSRRDKQTFDRLYDLFSEEANFEELRKHVDQLAFSPVKDCIPYLGIYLTDLTYIGKFNVLVILPIPISIYTGGKKFGEVGV